MINKFVLQQLLEINRSVKYLSHNRQSHPKGNSVEQIIDKADWEAVGLLTDKVDELIEGVKKEFENYQEKERK